MALYRVENDKAVQWNGESINDVSHPRNIEQVWSDEELNAIGLYKLLPGDDIPAGKEIVSEVIGVVDGSPKIVRVFQDIDMDKKRKGMTTTRLQLKAVLLQYGLLDKIDALVAQSDALTQMAWTEASRFERSSPLVIALASFLTWDDGTPVTDEEIDDMFVAAMGLSF